MALTGAASPSPLMAGVRSIQMASMERPADRPVGWSTRNRPRDGGYSNLVGGFERPPLWKNLKNDGVRQLGWVIPISSQYFWENAKLMATIHHQPVMVIWLHVVTLKSHWKAGRAARNIKKPLCPTMAPWRSWRPWSSWCRLWSTDMTYRTWTTMWNLMPHIDMILSLSLYLVGGWATLLKNMNVNWDDYIWWNSQYFWENAKLMATIHPQPDTVNPRFNKYPMSKYPRHSFGVSRAFRGFLGRGVDTKARTP